jgi:hypothetical protein
MTSERLIETLAAGLTPVRARRASRDALLLGAIGVAELALLLMLGGARHDLTAVMMRPFFWWKLGTMGVLAAIGLAAALRSFDPTLSPRPGLRRAAQAVGVALAIGWLLDATHRSALPLAARIQWFDGMRCMVAMAVLSLPMLAGLGVLIRRSAPTDRGGTALAAGIAGSAWGAFVFTFACPHDDPLYVAIWFLGGCSLVALAARWLLAPIARW